MTLIGPTRPPVLPNRPFVAARATAPAPTAPAWPAGLDPARAPVVMRHEVTIAAPPARVFAWLQRIAAWPGYSGNAGAVWTTPAGARDLAPGMTFGWKGAPIKNVVTQLEPGRTLGWEVTMPGMRGFMRWTLAPAGAGTRVVCEEVDLGFLVRLAPSKMRANLEREHTNWLAGLARAATTGDPP